MEHDITDSVTKIFTAAEEGVKNVEKKIETVTTPARESFLKRFPVLFALLVTFGVSTTLLGLERIISDIPFIYDRPLLMLAIGIGVLVGTGTLYKKLG